MPKRIIDDANPPVVWRNSTFTWKRLVGNKWVKRQQTVSMFLTQAEINRGITLEDKAKGYWTIKMEKLEMESGLVTSDYSFKFTALPTPVPPRRIRTRIKMKHFVFDLADEVKQSWDTRTGKCVFDYLIYKYKDVPGFKKKMTYKYLNALFRCDICPDEVNPLEQGVSIEQLRKFCDDVSINMYAFDEDENYIEFYEPATTKTNKGKPLVFRIFNDHFYPIEDKTKRDSLTAKAVAIKKNINCSMVKQPKKISTPEPPTTYNLINPETKLDLDERNKFALREVFTREQIPFPIKPKNFSYKDGSIQHILIGTDLIMTSEIDPISKYLMENMFEGRYQGENMSTLLYKLWEQTYPNCFNQNPMQSTYNIGVYNALRTQGVKTRTHYGLTGEEHLHYLEKVDISPNNVIFEDEPTIPPKIITREATSMDKWVGIEPKPTIEKNVLPDIVDLDDRTIIQKLLDDGVAKCYDIEKCYSSLILNPMDIWIKLDFDSELEPYEEMEGDLDRGLYFVETNDLTLLHMSNWYSNKILDYAKSEGIEFKIIYQIIDCSDDFYHDITGEDIDKIDFFKPFLDRVLSIDLEDKDVEKSAKKLLINQITGLLGKTKSSVSNVGLHNTANGVWDRILKDIDRKGVNPNELCVEELEVDDKKLWVYGSNYKTDRYTDNIPMYIQILDWSNILLHQLQKRVGGTCIYRKTDCIVMVGGRELELDEKTSETSNWGKPRKEDMVRARNLNFKYIMRYDRHIPTPTIKENWKVFYELTDSNQAEAIVKTFLEQGGGLIEGRAGTGKTFVIKEAIRLGLLDDDEKFRWCFTNKASRNLGGITIHKALGLGRDLRVAKPLLDFYTNSTNRWVVIDEIGMIGKELWEVIQFVKYYTGINFILLGDFRQVPPVEERDFDEILEDMDYFNHPTIKYLANNNKCELTTMKRYDEDLWNYAEQVSLNIKKGVERDMIIDSVEKLINVRNICYSNRVRKAINNTCQAYMIEKVPYKFIPYEGNDGKYRYNAYIYNGLPVMAIEGIKDLNICNSDEFVVKSFTDTHITLDYIADEIEDIVIKVEEFHSKFVVNYCSTTHKVQGLTIEEDLLIWESVFMDKKILYTAITRARRLNQVHNPIVEIELKEEDWVL